MSADPIRLLDGADLSDAERILLDTSARTSPVDYDVVAGAARFRAGLVALGAAGAAASATGIARAAPVGNTILAKIATKGVLAIVLPTLVAGVGAGVYAVTRVPAPSATSTVTADARRAPGIMEAPVGEEHPANAPPPEPAAAEAEPAVPDLGRAPGEPAAPDGPRAPARTTTERAAAASRPTTRPEPERSAALSAVPTTHVVLEEEAPEAPAGAVAPQAAAEPSPERSFGSEVPRAADPIAPSPSPVPPSPVAPAAPRATAAPRAPSSSTPAPSAADEMRELARAKSLIASDPGEALRALSDIARNHPNGYFVEERRALTIFALARAGDHASALERAKSFVRAYPKGPFTDRVRSTVGLPPEK